MHGGSRTRELRVVFVINSLGPGGAERSLVELVSSLPSHRVRCVVACLDGRKAQAAWVGEHLDVRVLPKGRLAAVRGLHRLIAAEQPDLVHTTIFEADVVGRLAA